MAAYIVFTRERTIDSEEMAAYWAAITESLVGHPIKVLAAYGDQEILEGPPTEGTVIAEFPSMETARNWYFSRAYQEAAKHRFAGAKYSGVLVQGV